MFSIMTVQKLQDGKMIRLNCRFFRKKLNNFPLPKTFEIIEDECQLEAVKPIYLPDDLEKVKQVPFGISVEQEMREFHKTTYKSGPFYRYTLENIFILKNRIYFEDNEYLLNPLEKHLEYIILTMLLNTMKLRFLL